MLANNSWGPHALAVPVFDVWVSLEYLCYYVEIGWGSVREGNGWSTQHSFNVFKVHAVFQKILECILLTILKTVFQKLLATT